MGKISNDNGVIKYWIEKLQKKSGLTEICLGGDALEYPYRQEYRPIAKEFNRRLQQQDSSIHATVDYVKEGYNYQQMFLRISGDQQAIKSALTACYQTVKGAPTYQPPRQVEQNDYTGYSQDYSPYGGGAAQWQGYPHSAQPTRRRPYQQPKQSVVFTPGMSVTEQERYDFFAKLANCLTRNSHGDITGIDYQRRRELLTSHSLIGSDGIIKGFLPTTGIPLNAAGNMFIYTKQQPNKKLTLSPGPTVTDFLQTIYKLPNGTDLLNKLNKLNKLPQQGLLGVETFVETSNGQKRSLGIGAIGGLGQGADCTQEDARTAAVTNASTKLSCNNQYSQKKLKLVEQEGLTLVTNKVGDMSQLLSFAPTKNLLEKLLNDGKIDQATVTFYQDTTRFPAYKQNSYNQNDKPLQFPVSRTFNLLVPVARFQQLHYDDTVNYAARGVTTKTISVDLRQLLVSYPLLRYRHEVVGVLGHLFASVGSDSQRFTNTLLALSDLHSALVCHYIAQRQLPRQLQHLVQAATQQHANIEQIAHEIYSELINLFAVSFSQLTKEHLGITLWGCAEQFKMSLDQLTTLDQKIVETFNRQRPSMVLLIIDSLQQQMFQFSDLIYGGTASVSEINSATDEMTIHENDSTIDFTYQKTAVDTFISQLKDEQTDDPFRGNITASNPVVIGPDNALHPQVLLTQRENSQTWSEDGDIEDVTVMLSGYEYQRGHQHAVHLPLSKFFRHPYNKSYLWDIIVDPISQRVMQDPTIYSAFNFAKKTTHSFICDASTFTSLTNEQITQLTGFTSQSSDHDYKEYFTEQRPFSELQQMINNLDVQVNNSAQKTTSIKQQTKTGGVIAANKQPDVMFSAEPLNEHEEKSYYRKWLHQEESSKTIQLLCDVLGGNFVFESINLQLSEPLASKIKEIVAFETTKQWFIAVLKEKYPRQAKGLFSDQKTWLTTLFDKGMPRYIFRTNYEKQYKAIIKANEAATTVTVPVFGMYGTYDAGDITVDKAVLLTVLEEKFNFTIEERFSLPQAQAYNTKGEQPNRRVETATVVKSPKSNKLLESKWAALLRALMSCVDSNNDPDVQTIYSAVKDSGEAMDYLNNMLEYLTPCLTSSKPLQSLQYRIQHQLSEKRPETVSDSVMLAMFNLLYRRMVKRAYIDYGAQSTVGLAMKSLFFHCPIRGDNTTSTFVQHHRILVDNYRAIVNGSVDKKASEIIKRHVTCNNVNDSLLTVIKPQDRESMGVSNLYTEDYSWNFGSKKDHPMVITK